MNEEKIVKINGIKISKSTGFKNLQFETSRYSDGLNTIRGFGSMLNESNLSVVDTISIDFILNYYELEELAHVYNLFKANGVLPIENEYLLKKIKSTYTKGKSETDKDYGKNDYYLKKDISHFICFLQRLSITSLEKTVNSYKVNMILTLYETALTKDEYEEYMKCYDDWDKKTNFKNICLTAIRKEIQKLANTKTNLNIKAYNTEVLNSLYKEHMVDSATFNKKLKPTNSETENEVVADKKIENVKVKLGINEDEVDISSAATTIKIPYHSIMQIELITNNIISNIPMVGKPVGHKSYLGIGDSHFSVKLIFNEYENDNNIKEIKEKKYFGKAITKKIEEVSIVEQLKRISDKNIINHKIELEHPLVQMFDFYTSNILNITFNNLEEANGIMVNIIFSLNGFRYSDETTINLDNLMYKLKYDNDYKQEEIGGLYLEYVADYLFKNRKIPLAIELVSLADCVLESTVTNNDGTSNNYNSTLFTHDFHMLDFFASYSSVPTSFGSHKYVDNEVLVNKSMFDKLPEKEHLNNFFNKDTKGQTGIDSNFAVGSKDMFLLTDFNRIFDFVSCSDDVLYPCRDLFFGEHYYKYVDNISALTILANIPYKNVIVDYLYSRMFYGKNGYKYIMNDIVKPISVELFNTKQNGDSSLYQNEIYKKIYDEFYYRLFYNLNFTCKDLTDEIKNISYVSSEHDNIIFKNVYKSIEILSDRLFELFNKTLYDGHFIERITREVINEYLSGDYKIKALENITSNVNEARKNVNHFLIEFESLYESNKDIIKERAYNIFLTKINYFLYQYCSNNSDAHKNNHLDNGTKYEEKFLFDIEDIIKIYIVSSAIHSLLLLRTKTRTDHFSNHIILGAKNIGYKISTFNSRLERKTYYIDKYGKGHESNVFFYQLFRRKIFSQSENENNNLYYKSKIKFDDFLYEYKNLFDVNPNKDINFFYGQQITQYMLYKKLYDITKSKESVAEFKEALSFLEKQKESFLEDKYSDNVKDEEKYHYNDLNINSIKFPFLNFSFLPSHYTELFYDKECKFMNSKIKKRVIGNIDPFENMKKLTHVVYDENNYIMPDYDICVYKKNYTKNTGDRFKISEGDQYIFLKNAASLSLVANPKTKIKTMMITLNNTSKSIFNFNPANSSFDMVALNQGKIDIINIEAGDEIRVRVGYDEKIQIFNGFIQSINNTGTQLLINCASFASLLYNEKINELNMQSDPNGIFGFKFITLKSICNRVKSTLEKLDEKAYESIRSMHNITNPLNDHLFVSNDGKIFYNKIFNEDEKGSSYSAFNLVISDLKSFCANKFLKSKVSDITQTTLSSEKLNKQSLTNATGSSKLSFLSTNKTYDIYTNINNIDMDYEIYGMRKQEVDKSMKIYEYLTGGEETFSVYSTNNDYCSKFNSDKTYNSKKSIKVEEINQGPIFPDTKPNPNSNGNADTDHIELNVLNGDYGKITLPVRPTTNIITSLYNELRTNGRHKGIDICTPTPNDVESKFVYSIADGVVIISTNSRTAGNFVAIKHKYKDVDGTEKQFVSEYMHLDRRYVNVGENVKIGIAIGVMGNTGKSFGTHLHFGIYTTDNHLNKESYLNPFDAKLLPKHNWNVDWNQVNVLADNGQYTEEWIGKYKQSKKYIEYYGIKGGKNAKK